MKYLTTIINTKHDKKFIKKSLDSLLNKPVESFFVFPFCLFNKKYYSHLKENRNRPYYGFVKEKEFEFNKFIIYGNVTSGQRSRKLTMKGQIFEGANSCEITIEFHITKFDIIIQTILVIASLLAFIIYNNYLLQSQ